MLGQRRRRYLTNDVLMLGQRLRRWPNIKTTLVQCLLTANALSTVSKH